MPDSPNSDHTSPDAVPPARSGNGARGAQPQAAGAAPAPAQAADSDSRRPRRGRVSVECAECSLGEITNLSPTGLRARFKGPRKRLPGVDDQFDMQVQTPDGPVAVRARIAWTKRVGFRTFDIGVHFVAADDRNTAKLQQLASTAGRSIVINETTGGSKLRAG